MRNYFDFKLRGSQIFLYAVIAWAAIMALTIVRILPDIRAALSGEVMAPEQMLLDGTYLCELLTTVGISFLQFIIGYGLLFFILRATVNGLSLGEDRFAAEYDLGRYVWLIVKGAFFSIITLGIYYPWFAARLIRYFAENTSFRSGTLNFNGKGLILFGILVLTMVLPIFLAAVAFGIIGVDYAFGGSTTILLWLSLTTLVLIFMMTLFSAMAMKWFFDFSFGSKRITSEMKVVPAAFFIMGQVFLTIITLGFYAPMQMLRTYRYFISRMVLGTDVVEDRFGFTLNVWKDYFFVLGQVLLTVITLGIYWPWAYARIMTRLLTHSYVEIVEGQNIPMPKE